MSTGIRLALILLFVVLLLGAGAWFYLFGPNQVAAAELVPGDSLAFATIPNAARLVVDYQTSKLKTLVERPEAQPTLDSIEKLIGPKNFQLLQDFLPQLSGQSFIAVTHYDPAHPAAVGLIAGLHPKAGIANFDEFVTELKNAYPEVIGQGTTGDGDVDGLAYQWIKGPTAADKICVARHDGWVITAWGEDSLRDWWERYQKKSTTPSLAQNPDYQKSLQRVGPDSETLLYLNYHQVVSTLGDFIGMRNPMQGNYLTKRFNDVGPVMAGSKFDNGEIVDRYSMLVPRAAQAKLGMPPGLCPFETLKFTGTDTLLYYAASVDFPTAWQGLQDQRAANPMSATWANNLFNWAQSHHLDLQRNIIGPLGHEISVQAEWASDSSYPEAGLFVKLDKPDDFKPTIAAIIDTVRQTYINSASISELNSDGQNFAALKFVQALPISPTITEDGPYFGVFLSETQAVRSFKRDPSLNLNTNSDFQRQLGARQKDACQMIFLDSPRLLDRGYDTARPYLPVAAMFNPLLSSLIHNQNLPPDVHWLDPVGTWSFTSSVDDDGVNFYSVSGIGNQGIFVAGAGGLAATALQPFFHPRASQPIQENPGVTPTAPAPTPAPSSVPPTPPPPAAPPTAPETNSLPAPSTMAPSSSPSAPVNTPPPTPAPSTNAAPPAQ